MEPTCPSNSFYIANGMFYKLQNNVSRGDIVVFYSAEYDTRFVKRVIGLPNDTIDIIDGSVYVNGTLLDESEYLSADICTDSEQTHFEVPDDSYFMLGDNREYSNDSRYWENPYISYDALEGKILATFKF
jgi:signal peptidase I